MQLWGCAHSGPCTDGGDDVAMTVVMVMMAAMTW